MLDAKMQAYAIYTGVCRNKTSAIGSRNRLPLKRKRHAPGFNYEKDTLESALRYLKSIGVCEVNLLPYHTLGKVKYEKMGKPYTLSNKMLQKEDLMCYLEYARQLGMQANIGG